MKLKITVAVLLVIVSSIQNAYAMHDNSINLNCVDLWTEVSNKLARDDASKVLNYLYANRAYWDGAMQCIASGSKEWIQLAVKLEPATDAGSHKGIVNSLGEALSYNPHDVIAYAVHSYSLEEICSSIDIDNPRFDSYVLAIREIDRREKTLSNLKSDKIIRSIELCKTYLQESKKDIARFYGNQSNSRMRRI